MKKTMAALTLWLIESRKGKEITSTNDTQWTTNLKLQGPTVQLKPDTSSDVNILSMSYYKKMTGKPERKATKIRLTSYTGNREPITGKVDITVERKGLLHELCFIITPRNVQPILGKNTSDKVNLIKQVNII